jgi:hypothetical protein
MWRSHNDSDRQLSAACDEGFSKCLQTFIGDTLAAVVRRGTRFYIAVTLFPQLLAQKSRKGDNTIAHNLLTRYTVQNIV